MASIIKHHGVRIVTLQDGESLSAVCLPGDIVIEHDGAGWWTRFVDEEGGVESYDEAFEKLDKAMWTAKAAAEFQAE
ncbi:MAG: hypothetical protein H7327_04330 [Herminiimonas sp.]|nr:hypothetical protein [Herminiimonas sp.]